MSDTEAIEATTTAIETISIDGEMTTQIPDFVMVANPFQLPIEEVVAKAYTECPMYDEIYGLKGGITRDGCYFKAMVYDHGRETAGFNGRLWAHRLPNELNFFNSSVRTNHNGWLLFDFRDSCYPKDGVWKTAISDMINILSSRSLSEKVAPQFDYEPLLPYYYNSNNNMIGRLSEPANQASSRPVESLSWSLPEGSDESEAYTLIPITFINSGMNIANVLYPLYIEESFVGFTVPGSKTLYRIMDHATRHSLNKINKNRVSINIETCASYNMSELGAALPSEYKGGYLILKGTPARIHDTLARIERLIDDKFPVCNEWRSTVIEPINKYTKRRCVYVPASIEMYNISKNLCEY